MNKRLSFVASVFLASFALGIGGVEAGNSTRTFEYHAGDASFFGGDCLIAKFPDPGCPDAAIASSTGDMIEISGSGEFTIHPKTIDIDGGGTFTATALEIGGDPVLVADNGTWEATELLSFKSYGPGDPNELPPNFLAGLAMIRIHLLVDGSWVADGILTLGCILPGAKVPRGKGGRADPGVRGGAIEGVRVNVQGGLNFNLEVDPSATLFIEQI